MRLAKFYFIVILFIISVIQVSAKGRDVRIVSDEAQAVLSVLEKRKANQPVTDTDWQKIFQSEGYVRLKKRELSMKRPFEDEAFKAFVLSEELLKRFESLKTTLAAWEKANVENSAAKALNYLPEAAAIRARIYPVIKPRENSFVFEVKENPAIFLYLDPAVTKEQFENTLAHELHHIGFGTACPAKETDAEIEKLTEEKRTVLKWMSAFGEGLAMLAAAGNADTHPHRYSNAEDRARWDRDMKNFDADLKKVEAFFRDVLAKRLTGEKVDEAGFQFFGVQGAWYTVGWKMAVVIEKTFGRKKLMEVFCDPRKLLTVYNKAARAYGKKSGENLAVWSADLLSELK